MFILFSPSEGKNSSSPFDKINDKSFLFPHLYNKRKIALEIYNRFIKSASVTELKKLFGLKKESDLALYRDIDIFYAPTQKAILRYSGVGYEYLNYATLNEHSKDFIDNHMIIFSNLFGPILAKDKIPLYKLKQGEKIDDFVYEKFYKEHFTEALDRLLQDHLVVDLRASFYNKFYSPKQHSITMKFLKNGKSVSHWAKAYRGLIVRDISIYNPKNREELLQIEFKGLKVKEIKQTSIKEEIVFDIID